MDTSEFLVISTDGLSKSYKETTALNSLDLKVPQNSIVGFLGPNGAGKSTTIKLLLGLIKPTAGNGTIFGMDIIRDTLAIRRRVGYLAQYPHFYRTMTARETLRFVARFFFTGPEAAIEERIEESLELVGLVDKADRPIKGFSGGEMQRLGIAQAQINQPDLLILDEPTSALDPMGRYQVLQIMEQLRERTTIFYSTHILDDVQRVSDWVIILNQGELVTQGPIDTLLAGSDGTVYSLVMSGDCRPAQACLAGQPWVSNLTMRQANGHTHWQVTVSDEIVAEAQLLRTVLANDGINVVEFGREKHNLEHVFINLVQKEASDAC